MINKITKCECCGRVTKGKIIIGLFWDEDINIAIPESMGMFTKVLCFECGISYACQYLLRENYNITNKFIKNILHEAI